MDWCAGRQDFCVCLRPSAVVVCERLLYRLQNFKASSKIVGCLPHCTCRHARWLSPPPPPAALVAAPSSAGRCSGGSYHYCMSWRVFVICAVCVPRWHNLRDMHAWSIGPSHALWIPHARFMYNSNVCICLRMAFVIGVVGVPRGHNETCMHAPSHALLQPRVTCNERWLFVKLTNCHCP